MKKIIRKSKEFVTESMKLPEGILLSHPVVEIEGKSRVIIENHTGIVKYSPGEIIVNTSLGSVFISGEKMFIQSLIADEIIIKGVILGVRYLI